VKRGLISRSLHVALEIELGDAAQREPLDDVAPLAADIGGIGDLERGGVAEAQGIGADLAAGKLAGDAPLLIDITVIALDPAFGPMDEFLGQKLEAKRAQLRPERAQRLEIFGAKRLARSESVVPAIEPGQRLEDEWKSKPKMGRLDLRRIEAAGGRNWKFVSRSQCLEARLSSRSSTRSVSATTKRNALAYRSRWREIRRVCPSSW
jgi:hypothetical protein